MSLTQHDPARSPKTSNRPLAATDTPLTARTATAAPGRQTDSSTTPGCLYLVPVPIGTALPQHELAPLVLQTILPIRDFIVENQRTALRFLSRILDTQAMAEVQLQELSEHTVATEIPALLAPLLAGRDAAIISEAGSPCIADPGAPLVLAAHRHNIIVHPLPGPVSLMLALMASGFGGQNFSFQGYLPVDSTQRRQALKNLERQSASSGSTIIFIETPYRNNILIDTAVECLNAASLFCVAAGLLSQEERVLSCSIRAWQQETWRPGKIPAVFLLQANPESTTAQTQRQGPALHSSTKSHKYRQKSTSPDNSGKSPRKK